MKQQFLSSMEQTLLPGETGRLGITGRTASGKDTAADYLVEKHGFKKVTVSDLLKRLTEDHTKEGLIVYQKELRRDDPAAVGKLLVKELHRLTGQKVVIAGIRTSPEWETVKKAFPDTRLIFIHSNDVDRYRRIKKRAREGDPVRLDDFIRVDKKEEREFDFDVLMDASNFVFSNIGA